MTKEIKVCLYANENDDYNELWKVIGTEEEKYYARTMWNNEGTWYYVADPLGYCELDRPVPNDVTFIMCDDKGNECFRYNNGQANPLPTFATVIKLQWNRVKDNILHNVEDVKSDFWAECIRGETTRKLNQWLISFKDPDIYGSKAKDYDENWFGCWHNTETEYTPIENSEFMYLGNKYQFVKVHHKHDICNVEWETFECCDSPIQMGWWGTESHPQIQSYMELGNWFDDSIYGTMYDKRTARERIAEKLLEIFPKEREYGTLLFVRKNEPDKWCIASAYCWEKGYGECAEMLINGDYHVDNISDLTQNIKARTENIVFLNNRENRKKIVEMYPEVYGYDMCLI